MPKVLKSLNIEKTYDRNENRVLYDERLTDNSCNVIRRSVIVENHDEPLPKKRQTMLSRLDTSHFQDGFSNYYNTRFNKRRRASAYVPLMTEPELRARKQKMERMDILRKIDALKQVDSTAKRVVHEKNLNESLSKYYNSCSY